MKFSPEGTLLLALGKAGVGGNGEGEFNQPSAVVTTPNGDVFVADGHLPDYLNSRIVRFDQDGKFLKAWGRRGSGAGEMVGPHAIAMDSRGRIFVADRTNSRILIFDQDGRLLETWKQFGRPSGLFIDKNDVLYSTDSESTEKPMKWGEPFAFLPVGYGHNPGFSRGIYIGDARTGRLTGFIPDLNPQEPPSPATGAEGITVDPNGVIYTAETLGMSVNRYKRR